jgi:hypothetical protein
MCKPASQDHHICNIQLTKPDLGSLQSLPLPQVLGLFSLSMMSTAAIVGAGIFVLTGVVAKQAG